MYNVGVAQIVDIVNSDFEEIAARVINSVIQLCVEKFVLLTFLYHPVLFVLE